MTQIAVKPSPPIVAFVLVTLTVCLASVNPVNSTLIGLQFSTPDDHVYVPPVAFVAFDFATPVAFNDPSIHAMSRLAGAASLRVEVAFGAR